MSETAQTYLVTRLVLYGSPYSFKDVVYNGVPEKFAIEGCDEYGNWCIVHEHGLKKVVRNYLADKDKLEFIEQHLRSATAVDKGQPMWRTAYKSPSFIGRRYKEMVPPEGAAPKKGRKKESFVEDASPKRSFKPVELMHRLFNSEVLHAWKSISLDYDAWTNPDFVTFMNSLESADQKKMQKQAQLKAKSAGVTKTVGQYTDDNNDLHDDDDINGGGGHDANPVGVGVGAGVGDDNAVWAMPPGEEASNAVDTEVVDHNDDHDQLQQQPPVPHPMQKHKRPSMPSKMPRTNYEDMSDSDESSDDDEDVLPSAIALRRSSTGGKSAPSAHPRSIHPVVLPHNTNTAPSVTQIMNFALSNKKANDMENSMSAKKHTSKLLTPGSSDIHVSIKPSGEDSKKRPHHEITPANDDVDDDVELSSPDAHKLHPLDWSSQDRHKFADMLQSMSTAMQNVSSAMLNVRQFMLHKQN